MTRRTLRAAAMAAAALTASVVAAAPAYADWIDDLGTATPEQIAQSVRDIEPQVREIRPMVREIVQQRTEGSSKVIDLSTDLLFAFGKADVNPAAAAKLPELVRPIPQGATVQVHGHTDGIGGEASNQQLSVDRANAVADIIRAARPDLQLEVQGFGESKPLANENPGGQDDPDARAKNRRVEVRHQG